MKLPPDAPKLPGTSGDPPTFLQDDAADEIDDVDDVHDDELPDVSALVPLAERLSALFPESTDDAPDEEPGDDAALGSDDLGDDDLGDDDLGDDEHDAFDVEGEGSDFEADDDGFEYGDDRSALDLTPEALAEAQTVATELVHALEGDIDRLFALEEATQTNLLGLLADLPLAVARTERIDEAAALASLLAPLDPPHFLGERALLLAGAGRREEALAQVTQNLETPTSDGWVEVKAAEVFLALDDPGRAEALLRGAMENAQDERVQSAAFDNLLELLDSQGRDAEVKALLQAERARLDALVEPRNVTVQHTTPKVGRNDPCPCGSGKKHKKCCLV